MTEKKKHTKPLAAEKPSEELLPAPSEQTEEEIKAEEEKKVEIPLKEYAGQLEEIDRLKENAESYMRGWQQERADFSNFRKRIEREQAEALENIKTDVIKRYLVILDDVERALKTRPRDGEAGAWAEGIELIRKKLQGILEAEGVQRIPAENEQFDPNRHEAITHEESTDHKSGQIIEIVQQGYTIGDRVIRPALVRVAK
jgi:molecular chaperone GrpE